MEIMQQSKIKVLNNVTINRIAAGEVVERPAAAIKELVENSIDAGADNIDIIIEVSGKNLIQIQDNGKGMSREELELAILRHATSKLNEEDLLDINFLGFRGEALPSIASISRMKITSRKIHEDNAWTVAIEAGANLGTSPASLSKGTLIEVRDLFFPTPARLKFLKSDKAELEYIKDIIERLAISHPHIGFSLKNDGKLLIKVAKSDSSTRIKEIIGNDFFANNITIADVRDNVKLQGFTSIPTFNRGTASLQFLFVNNRPIKDKLLHTAVKIAYQDFLSRDRHPIIALFIELPNEDVDVNVHPTKAEVRFRDGNNIRNFIISSIKRALTEKAGFKTSTTIADSAVRAFTTRPSFSPPSYPQTKLIAKQTNFNASLSQSLYEPKPEEIVFHKEPEVKQNYPLGLAKAQLHKNYILAENAQGILLIDQHAAHERLVYEQLKIDFAKNNVARQRLLIPEVIEFESKVINKFNEYKEEIAKFGLQIEIYGDNSIVITEVPTLIGNHNVRNLVRDLADNFLEYDENIVLSELIEHILETFACHHSVRSGRVLSESEMNHLLRQMEKTPHSGQCNHGRPTYIELGIKQIEKLFERS